MSLITSEMFNEMKNNYFSGNDEHARHLRFGQYIHFCLHNEYPYVNDKIKDMCEEDKEKNELWTKVFYTKNIKEVESIIYSSFMEF